MKKYLLCIFLFSYTFSYAQRAIDYVNPFIGTAAHGHTYPGATVPFGMVQLSPDKGSQGWDWCSGYNYSDSIIQGFSHTHLSGTGIGLIDAHLLVSVKLTPVARLWTRDRRLHEIAARMKLAADNVS